MVKSKKLTSERLAYFLYGPFIYHFLRITTRWRIVRITANLWFTGITSCPALSGVP